MLNSSFISNNKLGVNKLVNQFFEENAILETLQANQHHMQGIEFDQYISDFLQSGNQLKDCVSANFDTDDSGFSTSTSMSSPRLSPMSTHSSYNVTSVFDDRRNSTPSFEGQFNPNATWNINNMQHQHQHHQHQQQQQHCVHNLQNINNEIKLFSNYPSRSPSGIELKIVKQPEGHHRARYMTEGSRGTIKDSSGRGYPVVQLIGFNKTPVKLQCFIGHDERIGEPHLFYQACEVSGKTPYIITRMNGINVLELALLPRNNMQVVVDCVGILKERNVDVERKVLRNKKRNNRSSSHDAASRNAHNKAKSTHCRMVFRCLIPETGEILQVTSNPILCTQPLGTPEIYKLSLRESDMKGGQELFIIGKNFHKDARVIFESELRHWKRIVCPQKEFLNSTHLICQIPAYDAMDSNEALAMVEVSVECNHKSSDPMKFKFLNPYYNNVHVEQQELQQVPLMPNQFSVPNVEHERQLGAHPIFTKLIHGQLNQTQNNNTLLLQLN